MSFEKTVLTWLQETRPELQAVEVTRVVAEGSDWNGDTETGFYETSDLCIVYRWQNKDLKSGPGFERQYYVGGSSMASLWDHVMKAWPDA